MTDSNLYNTPNEIVTNKILARLIEAGLLPELYVDSVQGLLMSGISKPDDWLLLAEKTIKPETRGGKND
jgi:hypothetical protein